jgi:hypothetical protein
MTHKINSVWLFISEDETGEGIIGATIGGVFMPFVAADEKRLESLRGHARMIAQASGRKVKLIRMTTREEIGDIQ